MSVCSNFTSMQGPNLHKRLFWEYDFDRIDWQKESVGIIGRVIERGTEQEWKELIRYYSEQTVISTLKNDIKFLPDYSINDVCHYFKLKPEELLCYIRKQSRPGHWDL